MNEPHIHEALHINLLPSGKYISLAAKFIPGIGAVQNHIAPYAAAWQSQNSAALKQDGPLWVVLGDSMSQSIGASAFDKGWVHRAQTDILATTGVKYRIINLSMSGAKVSEVLDSQLPRMHQLPDKPDLVTVYIGSNDLWKRRHREVLIQQLEKLLTVMPKNTVVGNLLGRHGVAREFNAVVQAYADKGDIVVADLQANINPPWTELLAEDHFHPNDYGYQQLAQVFAAAIKSNVVL